MHRPLFPLLSGLIAGIAVGYHFPVSDLTGWISLVAFFLLAGIAAFLKWNRLSFFSLSLCFAFLGLLNINSVLYPPASPQDIKNFVNDDRIILEGVICENPKNSTDRTEFVVDAIKIIDERGSHPAHGRVLLSVKADIREFRYGDLIRVPTRIKLPRSFKNPGAFDYERYLNLRGITVRAFADKPNGMILIRGNQGNRSRIAVEKFRSFLRNLVRQNAPSPEAEIIQTMILGEQSEIPREVLDKFNRTGTSHILAISGFNVGIIAFLTVLILKPIFKMSEAFLLRFDILKVSSLCALVPVIIYAFIAGLNMATIRAVIMILAFLVSILMGRERELLNTLALAAFAILIVTPASLFDISFQLSFMSVAAILFLVPRISLYVPAPDPREPDLKKRYFRSTLRNVTIFMIVSLSATLGTLPLIAYYFNRVSNITLLANLAIVPLLGFIVLPFCLLIIIVAPLSGWFAVILIKVSVFFTHTSLVIAQFFDSLPFSSSVVTTPTPAEITTFFLALIFVAFLLETLNKDPRKDGFSAWFKNHKKLATAGLCFIIFFSGDFLYFSMKHHNQNRFTATFIDVGQGSSALLRFPGGKTLLVDGGGFYDESFDVGRYVVAPFLLHEKLDRIDIIVLTHPHPDHLNGLLYILENFSVQEIWTNGNQGDSDSFTKLLTIAMDKHIPMKQLHAKIDPMDMDGVAIRIFNPDKPVKPVRGESSDKNTNDLSLVMKFTYGEISYLISGDISDDVESRLLAKRIPLKSRVLLAPHHGSRSSNSIPFIRSVHPEFVVFSCGYNNFFRFPHPETVARYEKMGIPILRTDRNGAVTIETDGKNVFTKTFASVSG